MAKRKQTVSRSANKGLLTGLINAVTWIVGVLVSLAVGFGMISGALSIPYITSVITELAGWVVVIMTLFGVLIAIIKTAA